MTRRAGLILMILGVLLVGSAILSAGIGPTWIPPRQVVAAALAPFTGHAVDSADVTIVWKLRMPRIVLAVLVGAALAVAGALMQALFHNPMADPFVVGVSSGAAAGAVAAVALGLQLKLGLAALPLAAFAGGLAVTLVVYSLSRRAGRVPIATLLLTGIAVGGLMQAVTSFGLLQQPGNDLRAMLSWLMGSLVGRDWPHVQVLLPFVVVGIAVAWVSQRNLNVLALGDDTAHHLGVRVEVARVVLLGAATLLAAASVAVAGIIAFVGLMVPHLMRLLVGPNHRALLPACVLGGALLLLWADVVARTLGGVETPIGIVTSALGSPFFLYLLLRKSGQRV
jgi:iron complex transport system permease protein